MNPIYLQLNFLSVFNQRNSFEKNKNLVILALAGIVNPDSHTLGAVTGSPHPAPEADVSRSGSPVLGALGAVVVGAGIEGARGRRVPDTCTSPADV